MTKRGTIFFAALTLTCAHYSHLEHEATRLAASDGAGHPAPMPSPSAGREPSNHSGAATDAAEPKSKASDPNDPHQPPTGSARDSGPGSGEGM